MKHFIFFICLFLSAVTASSQCDFSYGKWDTSLSSMPVSRDGFSAVTHNDSIYFLGGITKNGGAIEYISSIDVYDPATHTWETGISELPFLRICTNACLIDNKIYMMGGIHLTDDAPLSFDSLHIYDIQSNSWKTGQSLPIALGSFGADTINGKIYVAGGGPSGWGIEKNLYVYDPVLDEWTQKVPMNVSRRGQCAKSWNGKLYAFGGYSGSNWTVSRSIEVYDPEQNQWTLLTNAPLPRANMGMSLYENQLLTFGGITGYSGSNYNYTSTILSYNPSSNSWLRFHSPGDKIPAYRQFPVSAVVDEKVFLFGGSLDGTIQNSVWAYSLKNIRQNMAIRDTLLSSESVEIDLTKYFSHALEEDLSYSICQGFNEELIDASIENSILKIDWLAQEGGSTEIAVNVFDTEDTISSNSFTVDNTVGIQTYNESQLMVYPNPASNQAIIKYNTAEAGMAYLEIYNPMGQVIEKFALEHSTAGEQNFTLTVDEYYCGLYLAVLKTGTSTSICKLMIRH